MTPWAGFALYTRYLVIITIINNHCQNCNAPTCYSTVDTDDDTGKEDGIDNVESMKVFTTEAEVFDVFTKSLGTVHLFLHSVENKVNNLKLLHKYLNAP